ncbi:MAG: hypothetical protein K5884_09810 [Ruminococcus sp.]|uniref:hypothetical protein n=1 Tax=uncultured Ruminococcus sp. TaxID=165186 RepID=UPI001563AD3F|nr:hypothetical protein [uncultured Ruminococcus sp.]MCR4862887.1 hypothetical protein [Ruminococcus sp.]
MDGIVYSTDFWAAVSAVLAVAATSGRIGRSAFKGKSAKNNFKEGAKDKND